ncbi:MAG: patatin-like phospholipase family protein [Candidatus Xenobia bacterium]
MIEDVRKVAATPSTSQARSSSGPAAAAPAPNPQDLVEMQGASAPAQAGPTVIPIQEAAPEIAPATTTPAAPSKVPTTITEAPPQAPLPPVLDDSDARQARYQTLLRAAPPTNPLGNGFPSAPAERRTVAEALHDLVASKLPNTYGFTAEKVLHLISGTTESTLGLNVSDLLDVERKLYQTLSPSENGYDGGSTPLFQALGDQMGAYVDLGPKRQTDAEHLMREFNGIPLANLEKIGTGNDDLTPVRKILLQRAENNQFPVFIDIDGDFGPITPTESIATESIASIAKRDNRVGSDFPDPAMYYRWLLTRIQAQYRNIDPYIYAVNKPTHDTVDAMKKLLTPPWINGDKNILGPLTPVFLQNRGDKDPFGSAIPAPQAQQAYDKFMQIAGGGQPPTFDTLCNVSDATVALDRDLVSGIQTYLVKMFRELSIPQRESMFEPLAKAWVALNTVNPKDPNFAKVSPDTAPYTPLVDRNTGKVVQERYCRAMALSQAVDHVLDGLGIQERKDFSNTIMNEVVAQRDTIRAREQRLEALLGPDKYSGIDTDALLDGKIDGRDPQVQKALAQLTAAMNPDAPVHPMTTEYAELQRHQDLLNWVANRNIRYGDIGVDVASNWPGSLKQDPLMVGEFYIGDVTPDGKLAKPQRVHTMTALGAGPSQSKIFGKPDGKPPTPLSVVLEGGGGKGFAFGECLEQLKKGLANTNGQVAIDEFVGNSAGALSAGLLAAGYDADEFKKVQSQLDFKSFYSDYLWLMGGVDPKVRGIDRSGIFSEQSMYQTMSNLLKAKIPVDGRPVLFRDLPFKLKVTATVINTDLPDDLKKQLGIGPDGEIVFSSDTTPNMDVAAALCCSAAVPGFFNAPQLQVFRQEADGMHTYRIQCVDGGTVNNFPCHYVSQANPDDKQTFLMVPAYYQTRNADGSVTSLSTLNFDQADVAKVDAHNAAVYPEMLAKLPQFVAKAKQDGTQRFAIGLHLAGLGEPDVPALQGRKRADTQEFYNDANQVGFKVLNPKDSATAVRDRLPKSKYPWLVEKALADVLGKDHVFNPKLFGTSTYNPPKTEAEGISDMILSTVAANYIGGKMADHRTFEQG